MAHRVTAPMKQRNLAQTSSYSIDLTELACTAPFNNQQKQREVYAQYLHNTQYLQSQQKKPCQLLASGKSKFIPQFLKAEYAASMLENIRSHFDPSSSIL